MSARDRALSEGTQAPYRNPLYYDQTYRRRRSDVRFYADLAESFGGPILELGVGTGRVAFEVARRGVDVVGVDLMPTMLGRARERLNRLPQRLRKHVELRRGDFRRIRLRRRFRLVLAPFNAFMHLYSRRDWERALATARAHLAPRGRLAFDVLMPYARELARDPDHAYRGHEVRVPPDGTRHRYSESFSYDAVTQVQMVHSTFERVGQPHNSWRSLLAHRHVFPAELEALLHYNGFSIVERWGDFDRSPLSTEGESQVIIARPRRMP